MVSKDDITNILILTLAISAVASIVFSMIWVYYPIIDPIRDICTIIFTSTLLVNVFLMRELIREHLKKNDAIIYVLMVLSFVGIISITMLMVISIIMVHSFAVILKTILSIILIATFITYISVVFVERKNLSSVTKGNEHDERIK